MVRQLQTEQDERQVEIQPMFVDASKKGRGIAWELNLLCGAFGERQSANKERRVRRR